MLVDWSSEENRFLPLTPVQLFWFAIVIEPFVMIARFPGT